MSIRPKSWNKHLRLRQMRTQPLDRAVGVSDLHVLKEPGDPAVHRGQSVPRCLDGERTREIGLACSRFPRK